MGTIRWQVVVSAPWLTLNRAGIQKVVSGLEQSLSTEDWLSIGSVIPFRPETPFVQTMLRIFASRYMNDVHSISEETIQESGTITMDDYQVDRAFVIVANKSPVIMQEHPVAA